MIGVDGVRYEMGESVLPLLLLVWGVEENVESLRFIDVGFGYY